MYWSLIKLVRPLKSSQKEALGKLLLCDDYNDLTSPTSNQIKDIDIPVSVVYGTLKNIFSSIRVHIVLSFIFILTV